MFRHFFNDERLKDIRECLRNVIADVEAVRQQLHATALNFGNTKFENIAELEIEKASKFNEDVIKGLIKNE